MTPHRFIVAAVALALAFAMPTAAPAIGTFDIKPVIVTFAPGATSASVEFTNTGPAAQELQVDVRSWTRSDGTDDGEPTDDLIASPSIFLLSPGQTQLVRLGPARELTGDVERTYRLVATEVPPAGGGAAIQTILRMRLPVFFSPLKISAQPLSWQVARVGADTLRVTTTNPGNVHERIRSLRVTAGGKVIFDEVVGAYVLEHQTRGWSIPLRATNAPLNVAIHAVELNGAVEDSSFSVR